MARWFFIFFIFIGNFIYTLETNVSDFTFNDLEKVEISETLPKNHIKIRGFLYKTKEGSKILAPEPNLKSCCVGSSAKAAKQIYLNEEKIIAQTDSELVTLMGTLIYEPKYNAQGELMQKYKLANVEQLVSEEKGSFTLLLGAIMAAGVVIVTYLGIKKKVLKNC